MNVNYNEGDCEPSAGQSLDIHSADEPSMQHVLQRVHELYGQRFRQIDQDPSLTEIQRANVIIIFSSASTIKYTHSSAARYNKTLAYTLLSIIYILQVLYIIFNWSGKNQLIQIQNYT